MVVDQNMMRPPNLVQSISQEVYRRFPDFKGIRPRIQIQQTPVAKKAYLFTFHRTAALPGGQGLSRWVRVLADERGKILKISTSR